MICALTLTLRSPPTDVWRAISDNHLAEDGHASCASLVRGIPRGRGRGSTGSGARKKQNCSDTGSDFREGANEETAPQTSTANCHLASDLARTGRTVDTSTNARACVARCQLHPFGVGFLCVRVGPNCPARHTVRSRGDTLANILPRTSTSFVRFCAPRTFRQLVRLQHIRRRS